MAKSSLHSYFAINQENYGALIDQLLVDTAQESKLPNTQDLMNARKHYIEISIARGSDLTELPNRIADLTVNELAIASREVPDKQTRRPTDKKESTVSFAEKDRVFFAKAARKRAPAMRWDNLFPEGKNDIILNFSEAAESFQDKVNDFLDRYNIQSHMDFEKAKQADVKAREINIQARSMAGKNIDERQIRLDPNDPTRLQTLNPNKEPAIWEAGPKLGKFLQEKYEWKLYDIVQLETESKKSKIQHKNSSTISRYAALKDIANQSTQSTDTLFDAGSLRVVISRDPQKIGEMSGGQRWLSCMAQDGVNYKYVPADIEAGTLIAYVVHQDDPEARYPLMRQLIKPFREGGDTILVPAKVYGGEGGANSRTRDGLSQVLNNFVATHNGSREGLFFMDEKLYADGQSPVARLTGIWTKADIRQAVHGYQDGALQEWMVELKHNMDHIAYGRRGDHNEDPEINIKKIKSKIQRVFAANDIETGLPRVFFREMVKSSIGAIPDPKDICDVISNDVLLQTRQAAFIALMEGDALQWNIQAEKLPSETRLQTALAATLVTPQGSTNETFVLKAWADEAEAQSPLFLREHADMYAPKYSALDFLALSIFDRTLSSQPSDAEQVRLAVKIIDAGRSGTSIHRYALKSIVNKIHTLPTAHERVDTAQIVYSKVDYNSMREAHPETMVRMKTIIALDGNCTGWVLAPVLSLLKSMTEAGANGASLPKAALKGIKKSALDLLIPGYQRELVNLSPSPLIETVLGNIQPLTGITAAIGGLLSQGVKYSIDPGANSWIVPIAIATSAVTIGIEIIKDITYGMGKTRTGGVISEMAQIAKNTHQWATRKKRNNYQTLNESHSEQKRNIDDTNTLVKRALIKEEIIRKPHQVKTRSSGMAPI